MGAVDHPTEVDGDKFHEISQAVAGLRADLQAEPFRQFSPPDPLLERLQPETGYERLAELLSVALTQVPFYEDVRRSIGSRGSCSLADFPVIDRATLNREFPRLLARHPITDAMPRGEKVIIASSGSTGQPTTVIRNRTSYDADWSVYEQVLNSLDVSGVGDTIDLGVRTAGRPLTSPAAAGPVGIWWNMPLHRSEDDQIRTFYHALFTLAEPVVLFGNTKLFDLADLVRDRGLNLNKVQAVVWSYETLTQQGRRRLEEAFGAPVRNMYGVSEAGFVATECSYGSIHFRPDLCAVELLDPTGQPVEHDGDIGELVITAFLSTSMPVIRYRTGDLATHAASCKCGSSARAVKNIVGRQSVRLIARDGRRFLPYHLISIVGEQGLTNFQIVQYDQEHIDLVYPRNDEVEPAFWTNLQARLLEEDMDLAIVPRPGGQFRYSPSGKRNATVQLMPIEARP